MTWNCAREGENCEEEQQQEGRGCEMNEESTSETEDNEQEIESDDEEQEVELRGSMCSCSTPAHQESSLVWLLVCHQFLSESLEQFYKYARCTSYISWKWGLSPSETNLTLNKNNSLFTFRRVKRLQLYLKLGREQVQHDAEYYDYIIPWGKERTHIPDSDDDSSILVAHMQRPGSCELEVLKLRVGMFETDPDEYDNDSDIDEEGYWNRYGTNLTDPSGTNGDIFDLNFIKP
jgi:hypothetical protein